MRILWHSNAPWAGTGYGQQTAILTTLLQEAAHDVAISAFWGLQGKKLEWNAMTVYPMGPDYGDTWLPAYVFDHGHGDPASVQVITLQDVWTMKSEVLSQLNIAAWCPVDHDPISPIVADFFRRSGATPIAMSRFGEVQFRDAGLDPFYAPHSVDTTIFKPIPQAEIREAVGIPVDAFVVGMVANNKGNAPPRKAFPQVFEAFKTLLDRHDDAFLYLHCEAVNIRDGLNLDVLAKVIGIPENRVMFSPAIALQLGLEQDKVAGLHNCFDVLACPSYGEGFGIPIIEAQACGVPVLVNNWTAMPELCGDGWVVDGEPWWDMSQGSYYKHARVGEIYDALEQAYERRGGGSEKARQFALQYDSRSVFDEHWTPILAELEKRMVEQKNVPAVQLNRKQRRRKKVA